MVQYQPLRGLNSSQAWRSTADKYPDFREKKWNKPDEKLGRRKKKKKKNNKKLSINNVLKKGNEKLRLNGKKD